MRALTKGTNRWLFLGLLFRSRKFWTPGPQRPAGQANPPAKETKGLELEAIDQVFSTPLSAYASARLDMATNFITRREKLQSPEAMTRVQSRLTIQQDVVLVKKPDGVDEAEHAV